MTLYVWREEGSMNMDVIRENGFLGGRINEYGCHQRKRLIFWWALYLNSYETIKQKKNDKNIRVVFISAFDYSTAYPAILNDFHNTNLDNNIINKFKHNYKFDSWHIPTFMYAVVACCLDWYTWKNDWIFPCFVLFWRIFF
jgi:hypothetical protein